MSGPGSPDGGEPDPRRSIVVSAFSGVIPVWDDFYGIAALQETKLGVRQEVEQSLPLGKFSPQPLCPIPFRDFRRKHDLEMRLSGKFQQRLVQCLRLDIEPHEAVETLGLGATTGEQADESEERGEDGVTMAFGAPGAHFRLSNLVGAAHTRYPRTEFFEIATRVRIVDVGQFLGHHSGGPQTTALSLKDVPSHASVCFRLIALIKPVFAL
jgi:hypothetical protein